MIHQKLLKHGEQAPSNKEEWKQTFFSAKGIIMYTEQIDSKSDVRLLYYNNATHTTLYNNTSKLMISLNKSPLPPLLHRERALP